MAVTTYGNSYRSQHEFLSGLGEADPPAGNQKLPAKPDTSAKLIAEFTFDEDFNSTATEGETPISGEGFAYSADQEIPEIVQDD